MKVCVNQECIAMQRATPLKKDEPRRVVVFTQAFGARCAWSVHLKCRCKYLCSAPTPADLNFVSM
jgi:hypothetical protein